MGMIPGVFIVQDEVNSNEITGAINAVTLPPASSCGASGGCGCGGPR